MKQGITFLLPVDIGMDVDLCQKVEFLFKQGTAELSFEYPSLTALRGEDGRSVDLIWTEANTRLFSTGGGIVLDTRITLKDSSYQPETNKVRLVMNSTLFAEVTEDDD